MFRIESYVTPIILSYVDKYVKNFRPQNSQMSLWGGEVSFHNLDLRLDVLEEELNLPFSFLSGHIHELTIRVPWTKIASEAISVTINTIEFVLKLKDPNDGTTATATKDGGRKKKVSKAEDQPAQSSTTGYMASLVNKIANNISIQCHNIIFKYIEDDLVMSMNVQLLSINSADVNWKPAFVDISLTKVLLRKLIDVTDLTICLDKRNESGKIEMCEEPILYRCSMKVHLLRRYNVPTMHNSSLLKMSIQSEAIHLNISSVQFPMVMRLMVLLYALKEGTLHKRAIALGHTGTDQEPGDNADGDAEGVLSWAWNLLPTIFPDDTDSEDGDQVNGHIMHLGCHIDDFQVTVKHQEPVHDIIVNNTKKVKYKPLLRLQLTGCYSNTIIIGNRWFNLQGGVKSIALHPDETCICGQTQTLSYFVQSKAQAGPTETEEAVPDEDVQIIEKEELREVYNKHWDDHFHRYTDELLRARSQAIGFDICHCVEIPDNSSAHTSDIGSDLEFSGLREKHLMRVFLGGIDVRVGPNVRHILDTLLDYAQQYNYPPYIEEKPMPGFNQLVPPSSDDYEALMAEVPLRTYALEMTCLEIDFQFQDHTKRQSQRDINSLSLNCSIESVRLRLVAPSYPNRLVHTTCQLPQPPLKLFELCYQRYSYSSTGIRVQLKGRPLILIPTLSGFYSSIMYPQLWQSDSVLHTHTELIVPDIEASYLTITLLQSLHSYCVDRKSVPVVQESQLPTIQLRGQHMALLLFKTKDTQVQQVRLHQLAGSIKTAASCDVFLSTISDKLLDCLYQSPLDGGQHPTVFTVSVGEMALTVNSECLDMLKKLNPPPIAVAVPSGAAATAAAAEPTTKRHSEKSFQMQERKISRKSGTANMLESVHSSSEKNATVVVPSREKEATHKLDLSTFYDKFKMIIISCEFHGLLVTLDFTRDHSQVLLVRLPNILLTTSAGKVGELKRNLPISNETLGIVDIRRDFFPWALQFTNLYVEVSCPGGLPMAERVVDSLKTNITFAITTKSEEVIAEALLEVVLHVDTTPLKIVLSENNFNFIYLVSSVLAGRWAEVTGNRPTSNSHSVPNALEIANRPISPDSNFNLKEFFDSKVLPNVRPQNDNASDRTEIQDLVHATKVSVWMQWTFAKLSLNLLTGSGNGKLAIEMEDIFCSLDQRDTYTKVKLKIGSLNGRAMSKQKQSDDVAEKWVRNESLGVSGRNCEQANSAFLDLTITKAETGIVHSKWGVANKKARYFNDHLIEIMLKMQYLDCKLGLEEISQYVSFFDALKLQLLSTDPAQGCVPSASVTSVADLPLIYFESKGFQVFLPVANCSGDCSVFIVRAQDVSIAPTVENPLTRSPVRADIYTKATQLRILNLPGSKIEDRQYEINFKNVSAGTANWKDTVDIIDSQAQGYENPALVWNNQAENRTVDVCDIFKDFHCSMVIAPAIVFNNVLVCGQSVEFNCVTDMNVSLGVAQVEGLVKLGHLLTNVTQRRVKYKLLQKMACLLGDQHVVADIGSAINGLRFQKARREGHKHNVLAGPMDNSRESCKKSDSGISLLRTSKVAKVASSVANKTNIPHDVTFLGGNFTINIYQNGSVLHRELATVEIFQPNLTFTQSVHDRTLQLGVFNMGVSVTTGDHKDTIFATHQGKLNVLGIPPSILKIKFQENVTQERSLAVNLFRPMKVIVSRRTTEKLNEIIQQLSSVFEKTSDVGKRILTKPKNWIGTTKSRLFDCSKLSFSITQLDVIAETSQNRINAIVSHLSMHMLIQERPRKLILETFVKGLAVKTNDLTVLHPMTFTWTVVISKESWQQNPVITVSGTSNFIHLDVGSKNVTAVTDVLKSFEGDKHVQLKGPIQSAANERTGSELIAIECPGVDMSSNDEHYQDDLRAGAFQYVEISSERNLPLPYQIQVINRRENRIICWRYPQARALQNVEIFPVPFNIVSSSKVECHLEYYSESKGEFLPYRTFQLSESAKQALVLPKKTTACVWRVLMSSPTVQIDGQYFKEESLSIEDDLLQERETDPIRYTIRDILQTSEDDGIDMAEGHSNELHPKILIACMKVDSCFNPKLIPNCNLYLGVSHIELNVVNHLHETDVQLPKSLNHYKGPCNVLPNSQHVGQLKLNNLKICSNVFDDLSFDVHSEVGVEFSLGDFGYLQLYPVIENFRCSTYLDVNRGAGTKDVNVNVQNPIRLRLYPAMYQSFNTLITTLNRTTIDLIASTRFVICNNTNVIIYYGQARSGELYPVLPKGFDLYAFRNMNLPQELEFIVDGDSGRISSEPCLIGHAGEFHIRLENSFLVIGIEFIAPTQRKVIIRGQLEVYNLSREKFILEISIAAATQTEKPPQKTLTMLDKNVSVISQRNVDDLSVVRICFENVGYWSGEIPIRPSGKRLPWLVKVPIAKNRYLSYWIRIVKQVAAGHERILLAILPLHLVRSSLAKDTIVDELHSGKTWQIFGRGMLNELHVMGTHDDEHVLKFNEPFKTASGQDKSEILLSYKALDMNRIFPTIEQDTVNIEDMIKVFDHFHYEGDAWPCSDDLELGVHRPVAEVECMTPVYNFGTLLKDTKTYNSLVLEVAPWGLFLNSSGLDVILKCDKKVVHVHSNYIAMLVEITNYFTLEVKVQPEVSVETAAIVLSPQSSWKKGLSLPENGSLVLALADEKGKFCVKLILNATKDRNTKILTLFSQLVAVNYTNHDMSLFLFSIPQGSEKNLCYSKALFQNREVGCHALRSQTEQKSIKGCSTPVTNTEFSTKKKSQKNARILYAVIECGDLSSCPININEVVGRKAIDFSQNGVLFAVTVSVIKDHDRIFVSIFDDRSPDLQLRNNTEHDFFVAQSESVTKLVGPVRECDHFEWYQAVRAKETITYSPHSLYKNYPDISTSSFGLTIALCSLGDGGQLKWSSPFSIDTNQDVFVNIPQSGDFKVAIDTDYKSTRIVLDHTNQNQEFSVRDIRSRLLHPEDATNCLERGVDHAGICERSAHVDCSVDEPETTESVLTSINWNLFLRGFSLVFSTEDETQSEEKIGIISVTLDNIQCNYNSQGRSLQMSAANMQVDNQLHVTGKCDFPVIMCSDSPFEYATAPNISVFFMNAEQIITDPLIQVTLQFYRKETAISSVVCKFRRTRLYLEPAAMDVIKEHMQDYMNAFYSVEVADEGRETLLPDQTLIPRAVEINGRQLANSLKIHHIRIESTEVLISMRLYLAVDHSPLSFAAFERRHVTTTAMRLGAAISMHYLSSAIFGAGWVVGSMEILGSPSGLARSVTMGLKDFVSKPLEGLFKGPWDFVMGVTDGSVSLVRNVSAGTVNSVTKFATAVARNLDRMTLDEEHVRRTDAIRRYRPDGVTQGITQGLTDFGITLLGAIGGMARHPLEAKTPGQVLSGVGKGLMGMILKPISGAAELVASTGNGVLQSVGYNALPSCRYLSLGTAILTPTHCKLGWKILQPLHDDGQILFAHIVTMIRQESLVPVFFGFSDAVAILLDLQAEDVTVIGMEKLHMHLDATDSTVVHLRILSRAPVDEDTDQVSNFHHIASRVREYIQSSREHLAACGTTSADTLNSGGAAIGGGGGTDSVDFSDSATPLDSGFVVDRSYSFYIHSDLAQHVVDYVHFLKFYNHERYAL